MTWKFIRGFSLVGLAVAIVLAAIRIYMLSEWPSYLYQPGSEWFDIVMLALWPGAFYLTVLQDKEPLRTVAVVYTIAIVLNPLIYGAAGWLVCSALRALRWAKINLIRSRRPF
jgi:hypothetical protein